MDNKFSIVFLSINFTFLYNEKYREEKNSSFEKYFFIKFLFNIK